MASFKILKLRSKKYDFLFLSYFFFFHLKCLHPLNLLFWTLGKKICGHLAVFQETRLRLSTCHISPCFFLQEGGTAHHSCFHSTWHTVWLSKCGWKTASALICPTSHRYSWLFPLPFLFVLSFPFTGVSGILQVSIGFLKYKILWEYLGLLNQGR